MNTTSICEVDSSKFIFDVVQLMVNLSVATLTLVLIRRGWV